ncbi:MAG: NAD-dependent epimerase/dehydratase family protein [Candidatus Bathyarchaeia archaeon]
MFQSQDLGKILVTGGAGFIGSHLVDRLCKMGKDVIVFDNLSSGTIENVRKWLGTPGFRFIRGDLLSLEEVVKSINGCDTVFHLAANPEVRVGSENPQIHYEQNVLTTFNLLEAIRKVGVVKTLVFTSSSTVYGDAETIPTPEDYAPLKPLSTYGASKLAAEALISAYANTYGFKAIIYRLANIVGLRSQHGVIYDFIKKLRENPERLEILGDGTQMKSYLHVEDCVDAILIGLEASNERVSIFNVGSEDQIVVREIADIVCAKMGLKNVQYVFTGGVDGGRGWKGDVKVMLLNIERLKSLGWRPKLNSRQAVERAVLEILHAVY